MRILSVFISLGIVGTTITSPANAQTGTVQAEIKADTENELVVPNLTGINTVNFYIPDRGSISKVFRLIGAFPYGSKISVATKKITPKTERLGITSDEGWIPTGIRINSGKERDFVVVKQVAPAMQSQSGSYQTLQAGNLPPSCQWLQQNGTYYLYVQLQPALAIHPQGPFTETEICDWLYDIVNGRQAGSYPGENGPPQGINGGGGQPVGNPGPNPGNPGGFNPGIVTTNPQYGRIYAMGTIRKDTCAAKKNTKFMIKVSVDLSEIDRAIYSTNVGFGIEFAAPNYDGNMASSIKPVSEGKFYPNPIGLMSSMGYGGEQVVNIYRFKKDKAKLVKSVPVADFVSWRQYRLARFPLSGVLTGGKGTFEYTNGATAYSVCFKLERRRQNVNGYGD